MYSQNIFSFYGHKLDVKLDTSEYYDFELDKRSDDFDESLINFDTPIDYQSLVVDSSCLTSDFESIKPWILPIGEPYTQDNCDFTISRRPSKGWTLDFVFNRDNIDWVDHAIFYYWGIKDETNPQYYLSNNLSFEFQQNGRIYGKSVRYTSTCNEVTGEIITGSTTTSILTPSLCTGGTSNDFNITIVFERHYEYEDCEIPNEGGWNDLITGYTVTNPLGVLSGDTEEYVLTETLNKKWVDERPKRLGTVTIYFNGRVLFAQRDVEEVIPSPRGSENPIVQIFGGGTSGSTGIHEGTCPYLIKSAKYFEEPLNFAQIKHHYLSTIYPNYNITDC